MTKGHADRTKARLTKELCVQSQQPVDLKYSEGMLHQLVTSELRYRRLFETAQDGIMILDVDTAAVNDVNPFLVDMLGYSREEFLGKRLWEVGPFKNVELTKSAFRELQTREFIRYEDLPLETRDGRQISVEFVSNVYLVGNERVIQCNIRDITERVHSEAELRGYRGQLEKRVEEHTAELNRANRQLQQDVTERRNVQEALHAERENFRNSIEMSPLGIQIVAFGGGLVYVNRTMLDMWGYGDIEELKRVPLKQRFTPDTAALIGEINEQRRQGKAPRQHEVTMVCKNGRLRNLHAYNKETIWNGDRCAQILYEDITERKQAEEALKKSLEALASSEKRYSTIFESATEGILITDIETRQFKYANPAICRMLGYSQEELLSMAAGDIHPKDSLKHVLSDFETPAERGNTPSAGIPCLRRDGTILYADINSAGALLDGTKCSVGFFTDMTDRRLAEEGRRQNTDRLLKAMGDTIKAMAMTVAIKDPYTSGHQQRVSSLATCIAEEMGLPEERIEGIRIAGVIHDIGKMYVPSEILSKPGRLNASEFELIKMHSQAGYDILKIIEFPWPIAQAVLQHHERMDGSGYPSGLSGKDIIFEARILAVADVVEAMASHRPYRPALGIDKALEEVSHKRGVLYDSAVVDACMKLFDKKGFQFDGEIRTAVGSSLKSG